MEQDSTEGEQVSAVGSSYEAEKNMFIELLYLSLYGSNATISTYKGHALSGEYEKDLNCASMVHNRVELNAIVRFARMLHLTPSIN